MSLPHYSNSWQLEAMQFPRIPYQPFSVQCRIVVSPLRKHCDASHPHKLCPVTPLLAWKLAGLYPCNVCSSRSKSPCSVTTARIHLFWSIFLASPVLCSLCVTIPVMCIILCLRILSLPRIWHLSHRAWFADVADLLAAHLSIKQAAYTVILLSWIKSASERIPHPACFIAAKRNPTCCWVSPCPEPKHLLLGKFCVSSILCKWSISLQKYPTLPVNFMLCGVIQPVAEMSDPCHGISSSSML